MIDRPGLAMEIAPHPTLEIAGPQAERVTEFVGRWKAFTGLDGPDGISIRIQNAPESHIGLGTGTQLGLATAALLYQYHFGEVPSVETLARSVGRGQRSGIGMYGFVHGGLIVDRGKGPGEDLPALDVHFPIPERWRFVLIRPDTPPGISGSVEEHLFARPLDQLIDIRNRLIEICNRRLIPALAREDFSEFSRSVYEFGRTSGSYFADLQGGAFNGQRITEIIEYARWIGVQGVGQSSWGPTIYLLCSSPDEASQIVKRMSGFLKDHEEIAIAKPCNQGSRLQCKLRQEPSSREHGTGSARNPTAI